MRGVGPASGWWGHVARIGRRTCEPSALTPRLEYRLLRTDLLKSEAGHRKAGLAGLMKSAGSLSKVTWSPDCDLKSDPIGQGDGAIARGSSTSRDI
jgi:hypothetical protein